MKAIRYLILISLFALIIYPAHAQDQQSPARPTGAGIRAGFGLDPDQAVIGIQAVTARVLKIFRFAPSVDFGFGDNVTTYTINGDLLLRLFSPPKTSAQFYVKAGPTITVWDSEFAGSDTEIGVTTGAGVRLPFGRSNYYNLELRYGFGDTPEVRLLFGALFGI